MFSQFLYNRECFLLSDVHILFKNIFKTQCETSKEPFGESYITNYSSVDMYIFYNVTKGPFATKKKDLSEQ